MISINEGDKFKLDSDHMFTVLCIAGDDAFVEWEDGSHGVLSMRLILEHIEDRIGY